MKIYQHMYRNLNSWSYIWWQILPYIHSIVPDLRQIWWHLQGEGPWQQGSTERSWMGISVKCWATYKKCLGFYFTMIRAAIWLSFYATSKQATYFYVPSNSMWTIKLEVLCTQQETVALSMFQFLVTYSYIMESWKALNPQQETTEHYSFPQLSMTGSLQQGAPVTQCGSSH